MNSLLVPTSDELQLQYLDAAVTHSNKYNRSAGMYLFHFFYSGMMQDVVFKLASSGTDYPMTLNIVNLAVFPGQQVKLISVNDTLVAYIDPETGNYQYFSNNLKKTLGIGLQVNWMLIFITMILLIFLLSSLFGTGNTYTAYPFILPGAVWLYHRAYNYLLEKRIDTLISEG